MFSNNWFLTFKYPLQPSATTSEHTEYAPEPTNRRRWVWVKVSDGPWQSAEVFEDTGSSVNWISELNVKRLGLKIKKSPPLVSTTISGQVFWVDEFVEIQWCGKDQSTQGQARFYVAPTGAPIQMLVGTDFMYQHPEVFMKEDPSRGSDSMLLTLQSKYKVSTSGLDELSIGMESLTWPGGLERGTSTNPSSSSYQRTTGNAPSRSEAPRQTCPAVCGNLAERF